MHKILENEFEWGTLESGSKWDQTSLSFFF